ncbi:type II toxin-antitoxin system Phd/YefM family antitoxin [Pseudactinotalea sp. Z1748]|uniref:type II toxin-antitoxin system Phd/YefM family antitoxin n=1 Tax=Pseudactinotalea sp. Z1748 TaxID=3413027 RepID=UPI003C7E4605
MGERTVSIRDLNQNAGKVVRSVADGGPIKVTDHGRVVAHLVPAPDDRLPLERLRAEGRIENAAANPAPLPPLRTASTSVAELVGETRGDR